MCYKVAYKIRGNISTNNIAIAIKFFDYSKYI